MAFDLKYKKYASLIKDDLFLHPYGDHGVKHAQRVLYLANQLAKKHCVTEAEWHCLALACCYHDIGRIHDLEDELHGHLSVQKMLKLELDSQANLSDAEFDIVSTLIIYHAMPDRHMPRENNARTVLLWKILKDADALDRIRFDDLDVSYLRLPESKGLIPLAHELILH